MVRTTKTWIKAGMALAFAVLVVLGITLINRPATSQTTDLCGDTSEIVFTDVTDSNYGADYMRCLKAIGISQGRPDGSYQPSRKLNRAQMASFLVRLWRDVLDQDCPAGSTPFTDVPAGGSHSDNITCLYNLGITKGTTDDTYGPDDPLKANQISRFMLRLYERAGEGEECETSDDELDQAVTCLASINVLPDPEEGTGAEDVTRDRMAVYMVGLWHNTAKEEPPPPPPEYPEPAKTSTTTSTAPTSTTSIPESTTVGSASEALLILAELTVTSENRTGYQRSLFRHWSDLDRDGCDTRREVLIRDAASLEGDEKCGSNAGSWYSVYDDTWVESAGSLDIDHLVPLAEAWDSGAHSWDGISAMSSPTMRRLFSP